MDSADFERKSSRRIANSVMVSSALDEAGSASSKRQLAVLDQVQSLIIKERPAAWEVDLIKSFFKGPAFFLRQDMQGMLHRGKTCVVCVDQNAQTISFHSGMQEKE